MNSSHRGKPEQTGANNRSLLQGPGQHYILPQRDLIASSIEAMVRAHGFQGMVMLASYRERVKGAEHGALWLY